MDKYEISNVKIAIEHLPHPKFKIFNVKSDYFEWGSCTPICTTHHAFEFGIAIGNEYILKHIVCSVATNVDSNCEGTIEFDDNIVFDVEWYNRGADIPVSYVITKEYLTN